MQIIPVIDIKGGIVVHAQGGNRDAYPPLKSVLTDSNDAMQVMHDMLSWYPFQQFYIADLDAIETAVHRPEFYRTLCQQFANVEIWLDAGITSEIDIQLYAEIEGLKLVIGSETLTTLDLLDSYLNQSMILSIDRRNGRVLGHQQLMQRDALWTQKTIVMDLDVIGADKGPSYDWLKSLMQKRQDIAWYAAGGVRNQADLEKLQETKAAGVLIASALHTGKLDKNTLQMLEQVHRPS